jgi:hypothetical protein
LTQPNQTTFTFPNDFEACVFNDDCGPNPPTNLPTACYEPHDYLCTSGTVTITSSSASSASGSYSFVLHNGMDPDINLAGDWSFSENCDPFP